MKINTRCQVFRIDYTDVMQGGWKDIVSRCDDLEMTELFRVFRRGLGFITGSEQIDDFIKDLEQSWWFQQRFK